MKQNEKSRTAVAPGHLWYWKMKVENDMEKMKKFQEKQCVQQNYEEIEQKFEQMKMLKKMLRKLL
jgi:adenine C2-methylase RlmN of 23S rRNA A2503 and tRNA A37